MSATKNYNTLSELYEGHIKRRHAYHEKKGTYKNEEEKVTFELEGKKYELVDGKPVLIVSEKEGEEKTSLLIYLLMPFIFVYYTLIGTPQAGIKNEAMHFFFGLLKFITYIYIFYNITGISEFISDIGFGDTFKTLFMGVFTIFSIFQFLMGLFTLTNVFVPDIYDGSGGTSFSRGGESDGVIKFENEEYDKTMRYMNAKMTGMSNSKKEKYLSDFYGGKLNKK